MTRKPKSLMAKDMNGYNKSSRNCPNWPTSAGGFVPWNR